MLTSQPLQLPCLESLETWDMWLPPGQLEEKKTHGLRDVYTCKSGVCFFYLRGGWVKTPGGGIDCVFFPWFRIVSHEGRVQEKKKTS